MMITISFNNHSKSMVYVYGLNLSPHHSCNDNDKGTASFKSLSELFFSANEQ